MENDTRPHCSKCGQPVDPHNSYARLEYIFFGILEQMDLRPAWATEDKPYGVEFTEPRQHVFSEGGCPGKPSILQYLDGYPRDTRPEFAYDERKVEMYREALRRLAELRPKS